MDITTLTAIISVLSALSGIALGWVTRSRAIKHDVQSDAGKDAILRTDVEYIKRGVDDVRVEQRLQAQRFDNLTERVTRAEESVKQAHKRLDRLEDDG